MAIIDVRDLVKVYSRGNVRAVDGISLSVEQGEVFAFLGPNGAGKTTCVKMMTTLVAPTSGRVRVAGHDAVADPIAVRNSIGVALQEVGLDPLSTGREMLILQAQLYAVAEPAKRAEELLDVVGLTEAAGRRLGSYSGGMKRRLDLAAALVHRPKVLFLDEPTTGLDPASRQAVWKEVRRLNERGTTIFLTTQYLEEADSLADRVAIIDHGRIIAEGTPEELKATISEDIVRVTVADDQRETARSLLQATEGVVRIEGERTLDAFVRNGAAAVPAIVRAFDAEAIELLEISLHRPTLDDVFLQATGSRLEGADATTTAEVKQ